MCGQLRGEPWGSVEGVQKKKVPKDEGRSEGVGSEG